MEEVREEGDREGEKRGRVAREGGGEEKRWEGI